MQLIRSRAPNKKEVYGDYEDKYLFSRMQIIFLENPYFFEESRKWLLFVNKNIFDLINLECRK